MLAAGMMMLVLGTATPTAPSAELCWAQVRPGLTPKQVSELIGVPLMRNAARGYERWVYDAGCEVQFVGGQVATWIAPAAKAKPPTAAAAAALPAARVVAQRS